MTAENSRGGRVSPLEASAFSQTPINLLFENPPEDRTGRVDLDWRQLAAQPEYPVLLKRLRERGLRPVRCSTWIVYRNNGKAAEWWGSVTRDDDPNYQFLVRVTPYKVYADLYHPSPDRVSSGAHYPSEELTITGWKNALLRKKEMDEWEKKWAQERET